MLREGVWRYSAAFGRYNALNGQDKPQLWQATLARGLGWKTTLYTGAQGGEHYRAGLLGLGRDFGPVGAVSFDVTHASSDVGQALGTVTGQSFAARYGKTFQTRTNLRFAGYRYSTEGYRDFDEAIAQRSADSHYRGNRRSRVEASVQQPLGSRSSLSLNLTQDDYWNSNRQRRQYQLQLNTQHHDISYNLFSVWPVRLETERTKLFCTPLQVTVSLISSGASRFFVVAPG